MMARFIVANRQKLLPYLRPIDPDPTWRERCRALLQSDAAPLSEGEALAAFEVQNGKPAPDNAREGYWAAAASAEAAGALLFDHNSRLTAGSKLAVAPDGTPPGPSFVHELIAGQHTPAPLYQSPRTTSASIAVPTAAGLSKGDADEYQLRVSIARAKDTEPKLTWAQLGARFNVSRRKAEYFYGEYRQGGESELRPRQRKCTGLRAPDELIETIDKLWKHSRTFNIRAIHEHPELRARINDLKARGERVSLSYWQLARYVRDVLKPNKTFEAMRTGKKRLPSPQSFGLVDPDKLIDEVLKVVQVDATRVDCHVRGHDGKSVLVRLHVLYALDVASRCLWAWRVCLNTPTEFDYLRLIQMGIRPKDELVAALGCHAYPVYGVPELILADRGWIFAAQHSRERLTGFGITVAHAAPYRPEMKGHIERFINTINTRFIHRLPGTTKSNAKAKGGRDAEAEARLTLDEFERYLSLAIIEGYSDELHTAVGATPLEQWERICAK